MHEKLALLWTHLEDAVLRRDAFSALYRTAALAAYFVEHAGEPDLPTIWMTHAEKHALRTSKTSKETAQYLSEAKEQHDLLHP